MVQPKKAAQSAKQESSSDSSDDSSSDEKPAKKPAASSKRPVALAESDSSSSDSDSDEDDEVSGFFHDMFIIVPSLVLHNLHAFFFHFSFPSE
jgi:hypothetical protein